MSDSKRCKSCGNPVDLEVAQAHDGACPWCLAAFTFSPEPFGNPVTAAKDLSKQFGKYVRTEKLGAGGMGEVWKALDTELNRYVALKFLKDEDPSSTVRFQREARTAAGLSHAGIASIHEVGEVDGKHFIAMQYVQGRTMAHFPRRDRRLIVRLFRDAARALDHAHKHGVVHRDLKPDNLMVEEREDGWHVVVLDFGLARPIEGGEKLSKSGEVYGTAAYMSPEQARGEHLDERADVYSLGATMYEVLTGRPPFRGANLLELLRKVGSEEPMKPRKLNPQIHRDLETIVLKCLEKDRERRFGSARELAEDLERFLNSDPILSRPPSTLYRLQMRLGKRKAVVVAIAAVLALVATAGIFIPNWRREATERTRLETAAREGRERFERARPHLEAGRETFQKLKLRIRTPYEPNELKPLAEKARSHFRKALDASPNLPEGHVGIAESWAWVGESERALESVDRALASDGQFAPAYLLRVLLVIDRYANECHNVEGKTRPETPEIRSLRERLMHDLQDAERFSKEYPRQKYARALLTFAQSSYEKAAAELAEYLEIVPEDWMAHYYRAHALYHLDRREEIVRETDQAIAFNARCVQAYGFRAMAKRDSGAQAEAIKDYTRVIELNPKHSVAYFSRGALRFVLGSIDEAIADLDKAIELNPEDDGAYVNRGAAKSKKGLGDQALADFARAIKINPKCAPAHYNRGIQLFEMGLTEEAIASYSKAIDVDEAHVAAYVGRGSARGKKGQIEEAIADFSKAIDINPKHGNAYAQRAQAWLVQGLIDRTLQDCEKAIALDPKNPEPYFFRGNVKWSQGRLDEAIADYSKVIDLNPKYCEAWQNRAASKWRLGRREEAIADYGKAIELDPEYAPAYHDRAAVKAELGLLDDAIADYGMAIRFDPKMGRAHAHRGTLKMRKGLLDEAMEDFSSAITLDPKDAQAYCNRGSLKSTKGDFDGALRDLDTSIELKADLSCSWHHRGVARVGKGDYEKGIQDCLRAVDLSPRLPCGYRDLEACSLKALKAKKFASAAEGFRKVAESSLPTEQRRTATYNLACAHALLGDKGAALDWLEEAVRLGFYDGAHIEKDPDLASLRGEERCKKLIEQLKSK